VGGKNIMLALSDDGGRFGSQHKAAPMLRRAKREGRNTGRVKDEAGS
jgi:hypothetical protein